MSPPKRNIILPVYRVFALITFGGAAVGRSTSNLPDYTKAKLAALNIKKLLTRESAIDHTSTEGEAPVSEIPTHLTHLVHS